MRTKERVYAEVRVSVMLYMYWHTFECSVLSGLLYGVRGMVCGVVRFG